VFVGITNSPRDFAWGAPGAISALLGGTTSAAPEAELWLGAHPGSPSRILEPARVDGAPDLAAWIAAEPAVALGDHSAGEPRLPFLLKVLAAGSALSLQAHPNAEQAAEGFARENAEGIPIDAPERNYRDAYPKPEMIYALSETMEALCGFRFADEVHRSIQRLLELDAMTADPEPAAGPLHRWLEFTTDDTYIGPAFEWLISGGSDVRELVTRVMALARANASDFPDVVVLADAYPGDPGIVISLMLNRVSLRRGEAIYLPAGNIHAYLKGVGVELMTASDNVLRGGLTAKHVDVPELLRVLDFRPLPVPYQTATPEGDSIRAFHPAGVDFELEVVTGSGVTRIDHAAILLCTEGHFTVAGTKSAQSLARGESFYVTPDEGELVFTGQGTLFLATSR
jgi:mannose-6-phosphate isomerase